MGDVFDAMDRARKERGSSPDNPPEAPDRPDASAADGLTESPGLPIQDVKAPSDVEPTGTSLSAPAPPDRAVTAATDKSHSERKGRRQQRQDEYDQQSADDPAARASLNGYAAELITHHDRGSLITEQYRAIRTQILARARNRKLQTTIVTSAAPGEGKTVTTINLGMAFSELRNKKTLLLEGDLRCPTFFELFQRDASPGLMQLLRGNIDELDAAIHSTVYENLDFIPSGGRENINSTELLSSPRMAQLLDRLKDRYDHIFIDTPPVINVTDASILGALSDQTVMVVRLSKTPSDLVERAKRLLRAANCEVAGVVLTHQVNPSPRYLYRYGYY